MRFITAATQTTPRHALDVESVLRETGSDAHGLSTEDALRRRAPAPGRGERSRALAVAGELLESLVEPLQLLLIAVGVLSAIFGETRDAIAIFAIIVLVATVETASELRAKRALRALRDLSAPSARVRRDREVVEVDTRDVVVGDVLVLSTGDTIAADARVVAAEGLAVDESALTGEPVTVVKGPEAVPADAPLHERTSMVHAGTAAMAGRGEAVVVAVGGDTEIGRLGRLVAEAKEPPTPLQRAMSELARAALVLAVAASLLVPLLGVLRGQPPRNMLLDGLTLAFATIPEELPILVTVLVAVGGLRLTRRGVLLRKLRSAEAAGAITVLLTDKTGTLTENRLELAAVEGDRIRTLAAAIAAHGGDEPQDPLDRALADAHDGDTGTGMPFRRFRFDPQRRRESAAWTRDGRTWIAVKGAPEAVLDACGAGDHDRAEVLARVEQLADDGLRVVAVAERDAGAEPASAADAEHALHYLGLLAFRDPLREGVPDAVTALDGAGVRTIVVSGDHLRTVTAVARQSGLHAPDVLHGGAELAALGDDELARRLTGPAIVGRATPEDKLRLVRVLQARGEAVAVTGDGVNDAPALAAADVGIAMGARGTDLARESADLVLLDDAYPTIVAAVAGGRGLAAQLRRAVGFYLGAKVALVAVIAAPLALGLASPFAPVHIVLLELFMDLGASVAFVSEPVAPDVMGRPPRNPVKRFLDGGLSGAIGLTAVALTAAVLPAFLLVRAGFGPGAASAAAVAAWLVAHAAIAWSLRSRPRLPWRGNVAFPAWAVVAACTAAVLALTPAGVALGVHTLGGPAIAITAAAALAGVALAAAGRRALTLPDRL